MLTRSEFFHDRWNVQTVAGNEHLLHGLTIAGSDASDGAFPAGKSLNVTVTGSQWSLDMEFVEMLGGGPLPPGGVALPSQIRRLVGFDLANGLVETFTDVPGGLLEPDDGLPVLICTNLDPALNPFAGATNPYNFTIDRKMLRERPKQAVNG
jgi:hypothetical protein